VIAAQIDAARKALDKQGLHGSRAELTEGLDTVSAYAATRERTVDCERLLEAFIATSKEGARQSLSGGPTVLAIEPPAAVTRAGGTLLDEFKLGRVVMAQTGCLACHRIGGQGNSGPGPDLTHVGSRLSPRQIARALISSKEPMPSFKRLPRPKFNAVVQFLSLLR
jgi:ubiquinol-cytochrome c reductase cytochrome b subunit/menaquinol-cytochrome c reductase cytochrome b/c subunit